MSPLLVGIVAGVVGAAFALMLFGVGFLAGRLTAPKVDTLQLLQAMGQGGDGGLLPGILKLFGGPGKEATPSAEAASPANGRRW